MGFDMMLFVDIYDICIGVEIVICVVGIGLGGVCLDFGDFFIVVVEVCV